MKKILLAILGLFIMLTVVSCKDNKKAVEEDLVNSIEALKKGDFSSIKDGAENREALEIFREAYPKLTYKINNVTEDSKDKIVVNVTMKYPNLESGGEILKKKIIRNAMELRKKSNVDMENEIRKLMKESIEEKLKDPGLKYSEETFDVVYVKNSGKWITSDEDNKQFIKATTFNFNMNQK